MLVTTSSNNRIRRILSSSSSIRAAPCHRIPRPCHLCTCSTSSKAQGCTHPATHSNLCNNLRSSTSSTSSSSMRSTRRKVTGHRLHLSSSSSRSNSGGVALNQASSISTHRTHLCVCVCVSSIGGILPSVIISSIFPYAATRRTAFHCSSGLGCVCGFLLFVSFFFFLLGLFLLHLPGLAVFDYHSFASCVCLGFVCFSCFSSKTQSLRLTSCSWFLPSLARVFDAEGGE